MNNNITKHLWQGEWIDDHELQQRLNELTCLVTPILGTPFPLPYLLDILDRMHQVLVQKGSLYQRLAHQAIQIHATTSVKAQAMLDSIISFISRDNLHRKLTRELGSYNPLVIERPTLGEPALEGWLPLGVLVHIAPTNVFSVPVLCVIEGLLSGNINILKTSASQQQLPQLFFSALLEFDTRSLLKPYIMILEVSSKQRVLLRQIIASADVVSAWGSEEAIESIRQMIPQGTRLVEWGHKISFAYFAAEHLDDSTAMRKVCEDVCLLDQNACSSPQVVFVETEDFERVQVFARRFATQLEQVSRTTPGATPSSAAQAQITTVVSVARSEQALGLTEVSQAEDYTWTVIADSRPALTVSPLFRTVFIKPLTAGQIIQQLHPMKRYLQTVALIAGKQRFITLSQKFFGAGCLRVREAGCMHDGYVGEPHDGVYALPSFMKRVSVLPGSAFADIASFAAFQPPYIPLEIEGAGVMDKTSFQAMPVAPQDAQLTFKSGGSSGKPAYSRFSYEDYEIQMRALAQGLLACGLDPKQNRAINLFAAGHLYGGFLSFFSIMKQLGMAQYPMGIEEDPVAVGRLIVEEKIDTLFTLPTLAMKLFEANDKRFRQSRIIKTIIFGGDHFPAGQRAYLSKRYGVDKIHAVYGSNDAGVLGYQCPECGEGEYHLLSAIQHLEVFAADDNRLLPAGEIGRLVFTSKYRKGQRIIRYDLGDMGFIHPKVCPCLRQDPKFTLTGRSGDIFKAGGPFLSYTSITKHLQTLFDYHGETQIILDSEGQKQKMLLRVEPHIGCDASELVTQLESSYESLRVSTQELGLALTVQMCDKEAFERISHSGKLRHIIDQRITG